MGFKRKYLICILQHRKVDYAITTFLHLHAAIRDSELRNECKIIIATDLASSFRFKTLHKAFRHLYDFEIHVCNNFYPEKLASIFKKYPVDDYQVFIKCDEEIFLSPNTWKQFLTLSCGELKKSSTLLTTVNLSTGIPSWYFFAKLFFNASEMDVLDQALLKETLPSHLWGNDYSKLNESVRSFTAWDEIAYWDAVNDLPYFYKGIHPIRLNIYYTQYINRIILSRMDKFYNWPVGEQFRYVNENYFCNSFFAINYKEYQAILSDKSLYVDVFDEVPLNRYKALYKKSFAFLDDSLAIHITYNTTYNQTVVHEGEQMNGRMLEDHFQLQYKRRLQEYLGSKKNYTDLDIKSTVTIKLRSINQFVKKVVKKVVKKMFIHADHQP